MEKIMQILIVEDEVIPGMCMARELQSAGYSVCGHAMAGEEAVEMARRLNPDLIVMDIGLPGKLDGIDAVRLIHTGKEIPVVFVTGYDDRETMSRASQVDSLGYLIKPVNIKVLDSIIKSNF